MPIGTAVHARTAALCESLNFREWSGFYAVSAYEAHHEHEYNAIRQAAAAIDVSPLYKYKVSGKDATRLVDRIITRDMHAYDDFLRDKMLGLGLVSDVQSRIVMRLSLIHI